MEKKEHQPGKKKKSSLLSNLMLLVCVLVFAFAAWKLWGMYQGYHGGEQEYEELRQYVTKKSPEDQDEDKPDAKGKKHKDRCPVKVDFLALKKINPQIVGWLYIPHSEISYPIVQGEDNIYYLNHTFERKENFTGAVFLDSICMPDFGSDNSIVYGHNLKSGEMFGFLKQYYDTNYNENADYKKRQSIVDCLIFKMVGMTGFEPATTWSQTMCSTKLSHIPIVVRPVGIEPATFWSVAKRSIQLSYERK